MHSQWHQQLRHAFEHRFGLRVPPELETRLALAAEGHARRQGARSVAQLIGQVQGVGLDSALAQRLLSATRTGRNAAPYDARYLEVLRRELLPELVQRRISRRELRVWAPFCGDGLALYGVGMMLLELLPHPGSWRLSLVGSEPERRLLDQAILAEYSAAALTRFSSVTRARWFEEDPMSGVWRLLEELAALAHFESLDVMAPLSPNEAVRSFDLVLGLDGSRELTPQARERLERRVASSLEPDGLWVEAEPAIAAFDGWETQRLPGTLVRRRGRSSRALPIATLSPTLAEDGLDVSLAQLEQLVPDVPLPLTLAQLLAEEGAVEAAPWTVPAAAIEPEVREAPTTPPPRLVHRGCSPQWATSAT